MADARQHDSRHQQPARAPPPRSASAADQLVDNLGALSINARPSTALTHRNPPRASPSPLQPRRMSMDRRSITPSSLSPHSPRNPTTPTLKHRSSSTRLSSSSPPALSPPLPQDLNAPTTVILNDGSYKHRYSRANTTLADLATIVERPERIPAAVYGAAAAQIRAGRAHLSIRHSVRVGKLADPEVALVHAHSPVPKGVAAWPVQLEKMAAAAEEKVRQGVCEVPSGFHAGDLYLCGESLEDLEGCVGALYDGVDLVFGDGPVKKGFVCIRPPGHHCAETQPSGFCWLNNVHIAIAHAAKEHGLTHAVILDFDLHHGDGSQAIAWSLNDLAGTASKKTAGITVPNIGYFSLHDINSYPCELGDYEKVRNASVNIHGAHGQFVHNVHLESYSSPADFWRLYDARYSELLHQAREFLLAGAAGKQKKGREFKAAVFLSAGFDASEHESPGMQRHKVHVPTSFFARFTADATQLAEELAGGRVLSVLEGGYSDRALTSGVMAHLSGLAIPPPERATYVAPSLVSPSLSQNSETSSPIANHWDDAWWASERLDELERYAALFSPTAPVPPPPPRQTSFMSATAASLARKSDIATPHRRLSSATASSTSPEAERPKPWEQRAWELRCEFVPEFEPAKAIPAVKKEGRAKAERHSIAAPEEGRRVLRERKPTAKKEEAERRRTVAPTMERPASRAVSAAPGRPQNRATGTKATDRAPSRAPSAAASRSRSTTPMPTPARPAAKKAAPPLPPMPASVNTAPRKSSIPTAASSPTSTAGSSSGASSTSAATAVPAKAGAGGIDELTSGMGRVRITYRNRGRDEAAEVAKLEREAARVAEQLARAKEATRGKESQTEVGQVDGDGGVGQVDGAREEADVAAMAAPSEAKEDAGPMQLPVDGPGEKQLASPMQFAAQPDAIEEHRFEQLYERPPPMPQTPVLPDYELHRSGSFASGAVAPATVAAPTASADDRTFRGGDIKFQDPFPGQEQAAAAGAPPPSAE